MADPIGQGNVVNRGMDPAEGQGEGQQTGVHEGQQTEGHEGQQTGVHEGQQTGVREGQQTGVREGQQTGVHEGQQTEGHEGQQTGVHEGQQTEGHEGQQAGEAEQVLYEPINVTVIDDNGKARIQTERILGLTKKHEDSVNVDLFSDFILITALVVNQNNPSQPTNYRARIPLRQDITTRCEIIEKKVDREGRLIIKVKKKTAFRLAGLVKGKKA